ncbi:MAG: oxidoreductase [Gemmatimonadota bacterium]|nr:oxidoreductase [Gemmatimonadota bacterium]
MPNVALVGFGYAGRVFHAPLIAATPGLTLAVVGSRQDATVRSSYPGVEVVPDPSAAVRHPDVDLVVIATPNDTHAPLADAALRAGKHVVVDKPFTITLAEARALANRAAEVDRRLSVFQNRRWDSDFLGIQRELAAGRIGEVVELRSEFSRFRPEVRDRWRERPGPGSGMWYDLGPHLIDQALVLFGPPVTVHADLQVQRQGGSTVDWFHAVLGYGRRRVLLTSSMLATDAATRFLVRGTSGSLTKRGGDPQEAQLKAGATPGSAGWGRDADPLLLVSAEGDAPTEIATPAGDWRHYYAGIRDAVSGEGEAPVTPAQATTVMAVIEAGLRSWAEGWVVGPSYTNAERSAWAR